MSSQVHAWLMSDGVALHRVNAVQTDENEPGANVCIPRGKPSMYSVLTLGLRDHRLFRLRVEGCRV